MAEQKTVGIARLGTLCRAVAATLIAGVWRRWSVQEVRDRLAALPVREEAVVVGGVLGLLLLLAFAAAQFGPAGVLVYLLAVILLAN
jgi:hypothetical protein